MEGLQLVLGNNETVGAGDKPLERKRASAIRFVVFMTRFYLNSSMGYRSVIGTLHYLDRKGYLGQSRERE